MSGGGKHAPLPEPGSQGDPSMEDILASIRRILSEEDENAAPAAPTAVTAPVSPAAAVAPPVAATPPASTEDDVLALDASMLVETGAGAAPPAATAAAGPELVAPEAARAAAESVAGLVRTLAAERNTQVRSGGPTIEDLVRAELRPVLKAWLDAHLPALVERLVRAEIERVVNRAVP